MQPTRSRETGVETRVEQRFGRGELLFGVLHREELHEPLGADPGPPREESLKMKFAQMHMPRRVRQLGLLQMALVQKGDGALDPPIIMRIFDRRLATQRTNFQIHKETIAR